MGLNQFWDLFLAIAAFLLIFALSLQVPTLRTSMRERSAKDWALDLTGLFVQGWLVPLAKIFGLASLLRLTLEEFQGLWQLPDWAGFLLAFVGVDYLYYWNHRWLHRRAAWPLHRLHHSTQNLDLFASARNSLITPFFIVYLWFYSLFAFLLADPTAFILGATLSSCLDLWRHSPGLEGKGFPRWPLLNALISPSEHSWHHSVRGMNSNFGANLKIWDKLHGTYMAPPSQISVGWKESSSFFRQLLFPWAKRGDQSHV